MRAAPALTVSIAFALSTAHAQNHLQPEASDLFIYPEFAEYYRLVRDELLTQEGEPFVAAVEIPGYLSPEWALVLGSAAAGRGRLEVRRARASIWYRLQEEQHSSFWQRLLSRSKPAGFTSYETTLGPFTARAVATVWESALRETRFPPPSGEICHHGPTYHFSLFVEREGQLTGSVYCPRSCSRTGQLVDLLYRLRRFAVLPESIRPPEQQLLEYAQMLADPAQLESRIDECRAQQAAVNALDQKLRAVSSHIEALAEWQYCSCGRWPETGADLRFFDDLHVAERRRNREPDAEPYYPGFDYATAQFSPELNGSLRISIPGHEWISELPECFEPAPARAECPRSSH